MKMTRTMRKRIRSLTRKQLLAYIFLSAVEEHNLANLGRSIHETLDEHAAVAERAQGAGVPLAGYLSAAFGYKGRSGELQRPGTEALLGLVDAVLDMGVHSLTLSDLQGVASPEETRSLLEIVVEHVGSRAHVGYHGHCVDQAMGLERARAALHAGVTMLDGSLAGTGGCITGAPGNVSTVGLVRMAEEEGFTTNVDAALLEQIGRDLEGLSR